jgi:hypothetical protein
LLARTYVDETHDAAVWQASSDRQFAEVFVERDEHTLFPVRLGQDFLVAWVVSQVACPKHVLTGSLKFRFGAAPNAGIEQ